MAAAAGFEPADLGVKVPCLTAWLRRYGIAYNSSEIAASLA